MTLAPMLRHTQHLFIDNKGVKFYGYVPDDYPTLLHTHNGRTRSTKKKNTRRMRRLRRRMQVAGRRRNRT